MWRADLLMAQGLLVNLLRKARETVLDLKDLLTGIPSSRSEALSRFAGPARCGVADLLITRGLMVNLLRKARKALLNLKNFPAGFLSNSRLPSSGLCRAAETWRGLSIDSARVDCKFTKENRRKPAQSKGLANRSCAELLGDLFGFFEASETLRG